MSSKIDLKKLCIHLLAIVCGIAGAVYGQPFIHDNEQAINVIVTVFSILAGFLVAVTTLIGDPTALIPGSWRIGSAQRRSLTARLIRHKYLFYVYLLTLSLIFASSLIGKKYPDVSVWLEYIYLGSAISGLLWSFALPTTLLRIQIERVDAVIEQRRKSAGIQLNESPPSKK